MEYYSEFYPDIYNIYINITLNSIHVILFRIYPPIRILLHGTQHPTHQLNCALLRVQDCRMTKSKVPADLLPNRSTWMMFIKHLRDLCQQPIQAIRMLYHHEPRQESNTATLHRVSHPISSDDGLNPPFHHNILLHQADKHVGGENNSTVGYVFLARASTIPNINADDVNYPADHIPIRHGG